MPPTHPTADQLAAFDRGALASDVHEQVSLHLDDCLECARLFERLEVAADPLVDQLRRPLPPEILQDDEELRQLLSEVQLLDTAQVAGRAFELDTFVSLPPGAPAEVGEILAPPQASDEIGRLGGYRVLALLGAGGMGTVYRAEDPLLKRTVALKVLKSEAASNPGARERFLREAQSAAALHHDNIVTIYQVGEDRDVPFLAMEYLEGESLRDRLKRLGRLDPPQALQIAREAAAGLAAAHAKGLIHRDIKPDNLWLEAGSDRVKVLDFGLARATDSELNLTRSGMVLGTPNYLSPEQGSGLPCDQRTDLFSLGVVLYEMLTGVRPFQRSTLLATLAAIGSVTPPEPSSIESDVPAAVSQIAMRLLARDPEQRYASGEELMAAIDGHVSVAKVAPPWWQQRPALIGAALVGMLLVVLGVWVIVRDRDGNEVARVKVPEGGTAVIQAHPPDVDKSSKTGWNGWPADAPEPAKAPFDAAQAEAYQLAWAKYLGVPVEWRNSIGMKFVLIPPGEFVMGCTPKLHFLKTSAETDLSLKTALPSCCGC